MPDQPLPTDDSRQTALPDAERLAVAAVERFLGLGALTTDGSAPNALAALLIPMPGTDQASLDTLASPPPGYEILGVLGRGGMGVVYQARHIQLNRVVALKMILAGGHAGTSEHVRFRAEAEAVAALQHPQIVSLLDFGEHEGLPYFTLEFVPGGSLADRLRGAPQPPRDAARLVEQLTPGVHYAHSQGIVHRDLKPANVLLASGGREPPADDPCRGSGPPLADLVPKVADFGLAKRTAAGTGLTGTGDVLGTPSYMAPEQAGGETKHVGPAADVYALGAILYECLTGRPPFRAATTVETVLQVLGQEPVLVRQLQPQVPRDLETVCHKCLQKDPARRYGSAQDLGDDLQRFLDGAAIRGRPVGAVERAWRWGRRHRALAALYTVSALAALLLIGLGFWFSAQLVAEQHKLEAEQARSEASDARAKAARAQEQAQRFLGLVGSARARIARQRPGWTWAALRDLAQAAELPAAEKMQVELRSDAAECLTSLDVQPAEAFDVHFTVCSLAWSPDGKTLAVGQRATNFLTPVCPLTLFHPGDPRAHRELTAPQKLVLDRAGSQDFLNVIACSPDGRWLAAGARSGWVHCWDLNNPGASPAWSGQGHDREVNGLAFDKDGRSLFSSGARTVRKWIAAGGRVAAEFDAGQGVKGLTVHPREGWVAVSSTKVFRLNAATLRPLGPAIEFPAAALQFTPDGVCLLGRSGGQVQVWHMGNLGLLRSLTPALEVGETIAALDGSADGALLLTASTSRQDQRARLWDLVTGRVVADLPFGGAVGRVAFAPGGRLFAVSDEKQVRLYEVGGRREQVYAAVYPEQPVRAFCLSADGRVLVTGMRPVDHSSWGEFCAWGATGDLPWLGRFAIDMGSAGPLWLSLSPGGRLAFASRDGEADLGSCGLTPGDPVPRAKITDLNDLGHDGAGRLWAATGDRVLVWDERGRRVGEHVHLGGLGTLITGKPEVLCLALGRRWTAAGCRDGSLVLLEAKAAGPAFVALKGLSRSELTGVALSADESLAVAGTATGELIVTALPELEKRSALAAHEDAVAAVRSAGNGLWASGDRRGVVRLWRLEDGTLRELLTLRHPQPVRDLRLHADGVRLYVLLEGERAVRVHHLDRLRDRLERLGLGAGLETIRPVPLPPEIERQSLTAVVKKPDGPHGLKAELSFPGLENRLAAVRYDDGVDCAWGEVGVDSNRPPGPFGLLWSGWLRAPKAGRYTLELAGNHQARLWLDGDLVLESRGAACRTEAELSDRPHELRVELRNGGSGACRVQLSWAPPGEVLMQPVASAFLFHERQAAEQAKVPEAIVRFEPLKHIPPVLGRLRSLRFSTDGGRLLFTLFGAAAIRVWDIEKGDFLPGPPGVRSWRDFSTDLRLGLYHRNKQRMGLYDLAADKELPILEEAELVSARLCPDGEHAYGWGSVKNPSLWVWKISDGQLLWSDPEGMKGCCTIPASDGKQFFQLSLGGANLRARRTDNGAVLWETTLSGDAWKTREATSTGDGKYLVIVDEKNRLGLFDLKSKQWHRVWRCAPETDRLMVSCSADGRWIITSVPSGARLWDTNGREVARFHLPDAPLEAAFLSPDARYIATEVKSGGGTEIRLWRVTGLEPLPKR